MYKLWDSSVLLFAAAAQAATSDWLPLAPAAQAFPRSVRVVTVNCNSGQRMPPAVETNAGTVEMDITGICVENIVIRDKDVMLKGTSILNGMPSANAATYDAGS